MLLCPYIAFLVAESTGYSGYIVLIATSFLMQLYAVPNMRPDRAQILIVSLQAIVSLFQKIAYLLMGLALPLHLSQSQVTSTTLTILSVPILSTMWFLTTSKILHR